MPDDTTHYAGEELTREDARDATPRVYEQVRMKLKIGRLDGKYSSEHEIDCADAAVIRVELPASRDTRLPGLTISFTGTCVTIARSRDGAVVSTQKIVDLYYAIRNGLEDIAKDSNEWAATNPDTVPVMAKDLKPGDMVDLDSCPVRFADPTAEFEYAIVEAAELETPDCVLVHYENVPSVGYVPDQVLRIERPLAGVLPPEAIAPVASTPLTDAEFVAAAQKIRAPGKETKKDLHRLENLLLLVQETRPLIVNHNPVMSLMTDVQVANIAAQINELRLAVATASGEVAVFLRDNEHKARQVSAHRELVAARARADEAKHNYEAIKYLDE